jgi:hypothetical protein
MAFSTRGTNGAEAPVLNRSSDSNVKPYLAKRVRARSSCMALRSMTGVELTGAGAGVCSMAVGVRSTAAVAGLRFE